MGIRLREADLAADEPTLVGLAGTNLGQTDPCRFRWLYRENPFGPARAWLAYEEQSEAPVGMCALFPRRAYIGGEETLGCVLGDFCVSENYRTLGPAVQLQRACLSPIQAGQLAFGYDFPSKSMLGVYRYLGLQPTHSSVRMAKLLRSEEKIRAMTRTRALSRVIAKAADFALAMRDREVSNSNGVEYRVDEEPCSAEYDGLAKRVGSSLGNCTVRNAEYLNWRYRRHPSVNYEFLSCYRGGELQGYCVFTVTEGRAEISDVFGAFDEAGLKEFLRRAVRLLRYRGASVVSIALLDNDPRIRCLESIGFRCRESAPVINCGPKLAPCKAPFLLMHGDRES